MRNFVFSVSLATLHLACASQDTSSDTDTLPLTGGSTSASTVMPPAPLPPGGPQTPPATSASPTVAPSTPVVNPPVGSMTPNESQDPDETTSEVPTSNDVGPTTSNATMSSEPPDTCVDIPDPEQTCATRKEWGNCEQQWLIDADYCALTCGRCTPSQPGPGQQPGPGPQPGPSEPSGPGPTQPTGPTTDSRFPPITSGGDGFATRYWDCAKPSCGWSANAGGNAVRSCDRNGNSLGVTDERNGLEGGNAFTCFSWVPWAVSDSLSFGFAATHTNSTCGKCYQLQFTGQGQHNASDPGSATLQNKTMVVMATNIGGDVQGFQLDTLIPGGGVGANNACDDQGVPAPSGDLGYGGFLKKCSGNADLSARKECVRQECNTVYGDPKFADLKAGCLWFVDWYNVADNPKFWSKEVPCPQELNGLAR